MKARCRIAHSNPDVRETLSLMLKDLIDETSENPRLVISDDASDVKPNTGFLYLGSKNTAPQEHKRVWTYNKRILYPEVSLPAKVSRKLFKTRIDYHTPVLERVLEIRNLVKHILEIKPGGSPSFLLRVDDFPWPNTGLQEFLEFHKILSKNSIKYLLGVTPNICEDPTNPNCSAYRKLSDLEVDALRRITKEGVELGLHGFTHKTADARVHSEIAGISEKELEDKIILHLKELGEHGLKAPFFVPTFNRFDHSSVAVIKKYFRGMCGGQESIPLAGYRISPSLIDGCLYVPSYEPAYGKAKDVLDFIKKTSKINDNIIIPITLHWTWERDNSFKDVETLSKKIKGNTIWWSDI